MYDKAIEILDNGLTSYSDLMTENEYYIINDVINELKLNVLNISHLRYLVHKAQKIVFKYSHDRLDLDEYVGY